jgi:hypothetical protein
MARFERGKGKERYWRGMIQRWGRSKQTVRAFCDEHGLSEPSFYAWRRTIAERDRQAAPPGAGQGDLPDFVPVRLVASAVAPPTLEVVGNSGRVIRVPVGFDAATLRSLLVVLEEVAPC